MERSASGIRRFRYRLGISLAVIMLLTIAVCGTAVYKLTAKAAEEYGYQLLTEQAAHLAALLDTHIQHTSQILSSIAALPIIADPAVPVSEKVLFLADVEQSSAAFKHVYIADMDGKGYSPTGTADYADDRCIHAARKNKGFITEPVEGKNGVVCIVSVPVLYNGSAAGILIAEVPAKTLSALLDSVQIAQTGTASVINETGTLIAFPDFTLVERQMNILEDSLKNTGLEDYTAFVRKSLTRTTGTGRYSFLDHTFMAAFTTLNTTGWTVIVKAPERECTAVFQRLAARITQTGSVLGIIACVLVLFVSCTLAEQLLRRKLADQTDDAGRR